MLKLRTLYAAKGSTERNSTNNESTHSENDSAKTNFKNVLLNECLEAGPPLQNVIWDNRGVDQYYCVGNREGLSGNTH